jgi:hypothetical protein
VDVGTSEEAPGLEEESVEALGVAAVRVEERECAEARAQADPLRRRWERRQDLVGERAGVARGRRVDLVAVDGTEQCRA